MTNRLDPAHRAATVAALAAEPLDVLVIGGGVVGAAAALDAASRGLTVGLIEARDWASGDANQPSTLLGGGLRPRQTGRVREAREALRERDLLLDRLAPHLVRRVPLLFPLHSGFGERLVVGAGLTLHDALARSPGRPAVVPGHRHLSRRTVRRIAQSLRQDRLTGAVQYYDAQVDDARLVLALVRTAAAYGALAATRVTATGFLVEGDRMAGMRARDTESGVDLEIRAKVVISTAGASPEEPRPGPTGPPSGPSMGALPVPASRRVHLVVPRDRIRSSTGIITSSATSVLAMIPWGRHWILATADPNGGEDPSHPAGVASDVDSVLAEVNEHVTTPLSRVDVESSYLALRPTAGGGSTRLGEVSTPRPGLVVVAGGTAARYRVTAADAVTAASRMLGGLIAGSVTDHLPLLGADGYLAHWNQRHLLARRAGLHVARVEHLLHRYGSAADDVLSLIDQQPALGVGLAGAEDYLAAEIAYAVAHEGALHLSDLLIRRTRISIETRDHGLTAAPAAAALVADLLGWDDAEVDRQLAGYRHQVAAQSQLSDDQAAATG